MGLLDSSQGMPLGKKDTCVVGRKSDLEMVRSNGFALRYVKTQTEELCIAAVCANWEALEYVEEQTEAVCMAAIRR